MGANAMFHRAVIRACSKTLQSAMRNLESEPAPIRDTYQGGQENDEETLEIHERQVEAMRRRDMSVLAAVLDEHFRTLRGGVRAALHRNGENCSARWPSRRSGWARRLPRPRRPEEHRGRSDACSRATGFLNSATPRAIRPAARPAMPKMMATVASESSSSSSAPTAGTAAVSSRTHQRLRSWSGLALPRPPLPRAHDHEAGAGVSASGSGSTHDLFAARVRLHGGEEDLLAGWASSGTRRLIPNSSNPSAAIAGRTSR